MAHFFRRAMVAQRMGARADWNAVDSLMLKALAAAEKGYQAGITAPRTSKRRALVRGETRGLGKRGADLARRCAASSDPRYPSG